MLCAGIIGYMTYIDAGFDQFLSKEQQPDALNPLEYDQNYPDFLGEKVQSTISGEFVGTGVNADNITAGFLRFDRAKGGMLQLGGAGNNRGQFALKDDDDNDRITMDKDGMIVRDGAIVVKNADGQSVFDAGGLVSQTNFKTSNNIQVAVNQTISGGLTDVTSSSYTFLLKRPTNVLFLYAVGMYLTESVGNTGDGEVDLNIDGANKSQIIFRSGNTSALTLSKYYITGLSAGVHTIKIQGAINISAGSPTLNIVDFTSGFVALGS